jgi:serine/threonine protein kinase
MTVDDELARWGEPPVSPCEEELMKIVEQFFNHKELGDRTQLDEMLQGNPELALKWQELVNAEERIEDFVQSVLEHSGIGGPVAPPDVEATSGPEGRVSDDAGDLPKELDREFRVRQFLGEGSFSRVWLADDLGLQIPVALKTLRFRVSGAEKELALTALRNEAQVIARLHHPNIVRVYRLFQCGGKHWLVLQFVDGGSLEELLKKGGPLPWQRAARYIADVGEALLHLHGKGIVHRDVKLANILWDQYRNEALLTDFGLAAHLSVKSQVAGTPLYMAPEAFAGQNSFASDVYGLAASLFTLLTGRVPFPGKTRAEILERISQGLPDQKALFDRVPLPLEQIVRSGLAAAPANRPELKKFVAELRGSLNRLLADLLPSTPTCRIQGPLHSGLRTLFVSNWLSRHFRLRTLFVSNRLSRSPVDLQLTVARCESDNVYVPVAGSRRKDPGFTRDIKRVPPHPDRVVLRTGDRVRIQVTADRKGFLTLFNVGPQGHLNLLYPDSASTAPGAIHGHQPLVLTDIAMTPPPGNERLFAVWSRTPLPLEFALAGQDTDTLSPAYRATRNIERVELVVSHRPRKDWHAVVLEIDHVS